jgi:predicted DNA-binding ribbon-helix-helix protein
MFGSAVLIRGKVAHQTAVESTPVEQIVKRVLRHTVYPSNQLKKIRTSGGCLSIILLLKRHNGAQTLHWTVIILSFNRSILPHPRKCDMKSSVIKRSVVIAGRRSSVSVEDDFWSSLRDIAKQRHQTLSDLISSIKAEREQTNLSSSIRLFVLGFYRHQFESIEPDHQRQRQLRPQAHVDCGSA